MAIFRAAMAIMFLAITVPSAVANPVPPTFLIAGAGLGHGVGMSQVGAFVQAQNGRSAAEILAHYYPAAQLIQVDDAVPILVNVAANQTSLTLAATPIRKTDQSSLTITNLESPINSIEPLNVAAENGTLVFTASSGELVRMPTAEIAWSGVVGFTSAEPKSELVLTRADGSSTKYRFGPLLLSARGNSVQAVLKLQVKDEYLNLVAEVASTWPTAALEAQAIASRSIAMTAVNAGAKTSCGCHVFSVGDQNMRGSERYRLPGYANWRKSIRTTAGQVIGLDQKPVAAWFFARSNGKTENSEDVWGSPRPWAKSVDDQFSIDPLAGPQVKWSVPVSAAQLARLFKLPDVVKVQVASRNSGGSVRMFRAVSSTGEKALLSGRNLRAAIPTRSVWIEDIKPVVN